MEERKKKLTTVKEWINTIAILLLIAIVGFCVGFFLTPKTMRENDLTECKVVAQQIFDRPGSMMIEAPEGYSVTMTETHITVQNDSYLGSVEATLLNGELLFKMNNGTSTKVFFGIACAALSWAILVIIVLIQKFKEF